MPDVTATTTAPWRTVQDRTLDELLELLEIGPGHDRDSSLGAALLHVGRGLPATVRAAQEHAGAAWRELMDHIHDTPAYVPASDHSDWQGAAREIQASYALRVGLLIGYAAATQEEVTAGDAVQAAKTAAFHVDSDQDLADWVGLAPAHA